MKDLLEIIDDIQSDFDIYIDNEEVKKAYKKGYIDGLNHFKKDYL